MEENRPPAKKNPLLIGAILVVLGVLFIVGRYINLGGVARLWPLFMLIPVAAITSTMLKDPRKNAESLIPIVILTFLCVYFLWLNFTDWSRVANTWPNFILAPGLGLTAAWLVTRERRLMVSALIILGIGVVMYARIFLENAGVRMDRFVLLGILCIIIGTTLIISRMRNKKTGK